MPPAKNSALKSSCKEKARNRNLMMDRHLDPFSAQVENEYGSYGLQTGTCDKAYLSRLRDVTNELTGHKTVLFSTDGNSDQLGNCTLTARPLLKLFGTIGTSV